MGNPEEAAVFISVLAIVAVCGLAGIWNNWIWIGKNGYNLPYELRPSFCRFWFSVVPRKIVGLKTGMENITLSTDRY
jgi:hypothetical protein